MSHELGRWTLFCVRLGVWPFDFYFPGELWEDLIQMCETFPSHPELIGGDFNVTLAA